MKASLRSAILALATALAFLLLLPLLIWSLLPLPNYSRFTAPSQLIALVPGYAGVMLRRVWYKLKLKRCGDRLTVDWMAVIRTPDAEVGDRCTFGVGNWIGLASIGSDVMTGNHVTITSGARQHPLSDTSRPMREQHGMKSRVLIASDVWIGAHAVIMTDVAKGTVIGAGSIVTKTFDDFMVIAGNPARPLRSREADRQVPS